jgi:hypothetical protein
VHRARDRYSKLPDRERERVKHAYCQALHDAINQHDAKRRLQALADDLDKQGFTATAPAWPTTSTRSWSTCAKRAPSDGFSHERRNGGKSRHGEP